MYLSLFIGYSKTDAGIKVTEASDICVSCGNKIPGN